MKFVESRHPRDLNGRFRDKVPLSTGLSLPPPPDREPEIPDEVAVFNAKSTFDELHAVFTPDHPVEDRMQAAYSLVPGVASLASHDPDVRVRAIAVFGWDLTDDERARLENDSEVNEYRAMVSGH